MVNIDYEDGHYVFNDNYEEIKAEPEYEAEVTEFLSKYFSPDDFQVYVRIDELEENGGSVVERATCRPQVYVKGVYSEQESEAAAQAYAEWIADMDIGGGGIDLYFYDTEDYTKINALTVDDHDFKPRFSFDVSIHSDNSIEIKRHRK